MSYKPKILAVPDGGTGDNTLTNHGILLGQGTSAIVATSAGATGTVLIGTTASDPSFSATPTVTSITLSNAPVNGTDGTNKTYVDAAIASVNPATSVYAATTVDIPGVYNNGASGIGATFLTTATGAFTLDGTTPPLLSRILFKNQSVGPNTAAYNGVYVLTTNGTGITGSTFTRATDYNQPSDINSTGVIAVINGTANQLTGWLLTTTITTIGTDPLTYVLYTNAPISVTQYDVLVGGAGNTIGSVGPGSAGQVLRSGGNAANPAYSTATYPATATGTGTILRADGTNWVATTATYPTTTTANQLLYSSSTSVIGGLATAANATLVTDGSSVPSISQTLPAAVQGNITAVGTIASGTWNGTVIDVAHGGTGRATLTNHGVLVGASTTAITQLAAGSAGQVLQSGGASADPAYSTATYPATAGTSGNVLTSDGSNWTSAAPTLLTAVTTPGAYPYTTLTTDQLILVDTASARTITPMGSPTTGRTHRIKDSVGSGATNNITITPSGKNIDGAASYVINTNYGSVDIIYNGTEWSIL